MNWKDRLQNKSIKEILEASNEEVEAILDAQNDNEPGASARILDALRPYLSKPGSDSPDSTSNVVPLKSSDVSPNDSTKRAQSLAESDGIDGQQDFVTFDELSQLAAATASESSIRTKSEFKLSDGNHVVQVWNGELGGSQLYVRACELPDSATGFTSFGFGFSFEEVDTDPRWIAISGATLQTLKKLTQQQSGKSKHELKVEFV